MDKKEKTEKEIKEMAFGMQMEITKMKNDYIRNVINGRYFLARCNMIAVQVQNKAVRESIDGCPKTLELMRTEYAMQKMQAIISMRNAHFAKKDLLERKFTEEDIVAIEEDYYDGKVIREEYDESYKKGNKAEFVESDK